MSHPQLSRAAHTRLSAELELLETTGRQDAVDSIADSASGDPADQAFGVEAIAMSHRLEDHIRELRAKLEGAEIVDKVAASDVVVGGCVVTVHYEGDDDTEEYLVGSIEERRDGVATLTPDSPMGRALLGAAIGNTVSYETPAGHCDVKIISIAC